MKRDEDGRLIVKDTVSSFITKFIFGCLAGGFCSTFLVLIGVMIVGAAENDPTALITAYVIVLSLISGFLVAFLMD